MRVRTGRRHTGAGANNGLPEDTVRGHETVWTDRFIDWLEVVKRLVTPSDVLVFACHLHDPAHLTDSFDWFRAFPQDIKDDAVDQHTKLAMPVLAIGADHSLGAAEATQVPQYATHVTGMVIKNSSHWIYEEHPAQMTQILLNFLH